MQDRDTKELLAAARSTARETQELVEQSKEQINGIGQNLRVLTWCTDQIKSLLGIRRKDRDASESSPDSGVLPP